MSNDTQPSKVLIGYVPLLDPKSVMHKPGEYVSTDSLVNLELDPALIEGVAWVGNQEEPYEVAPVFVMENAKAVCEHLKFWCEGDFSRFTLRAVQNDIGYAIALVPDPNQSILRWKTARLAFHEEIVDDSDFVVFYRYLGVFCPGNRLESLNDKVLAKTMLGFVNKSTVDDMNTIEYVGPFDFIIGDDRHLSELYPRVEDEHPQPT